MFQNVTSHAFNMINRLNIVGLLDLPPAEVRPLLPCLVRMSLCSSLDTSSQWQDKKKYLLQLLSGMNAVNHIIALLSVDFHDLEEDARKEQQMRSKMGYSNGTESILIAGLKQQGLLLEFEGSEPSRCFRIVLSELLPVMQLIESNEILNKNTIVESELFACEAYLHDVSDVVCILCAELPSLLQLSVVAEALLYFPNGIKVLCKLLANNSESLLPVCHSLLQTHNSQLNGITDSKNRLFNERLRSEALQALCFIHPEYTLLVRSLCVQRCQLPDLAVSLTLIYASNCKAESSSMVQSDKENSVSDLVSFVSGLLLGNDSKTRSWFATYIRHTKETTDNKLRAELVNELRTVVKTAEVKSDIKMVEDSGGDDSASHTESNSVESMYLLLDEHCLCAAALIRLYCALKAIAGLKFTNEESDLLLRLITCFPPLTPSGIRFVSLALGMLLACPSLLAGLEQEKQAVSWIKWLASRSSEMETVGPEGCSFAEQLLLTAIHLHGDRQSAAVRLACSTLGMRIKVNSTSLTKLRHIFTEEVFPTQVVAAHAMKIPVTKKLNASMAGYMPVHCIYQLLKTRSFSQGRIPVKDWIFKQLCEADCPLHPQLQPLVSQYVTTIVTPTSKGTHHSGSLNDPFSESQILSVFGVQGSDNKSSTSYIDSESSYSLTAKLLFLYYVLSYEDAILNNMKTLALLPKRPLQYRHTLINQIPVKYLLYKAQKHPKSCQGLYPALLGLLTTHLPHLCLVEDWMQDLDTLPQSAALPSASLQPRPCGKKKTSIDIKPNHLYDGLKRSVVNPAPALMHLRTLSHPHVSAEDVIPFANSLTRGFPFILDEKVSRRVRQEAQKLWLKLNSVIPRKLWVLTINCLQTSSINSNNFPLDEPLNCNVTFDDLVEDPLLPLTVDMRVLKCPELLGIMLRILSACLSASKSQALTLLRANPTLDSKQSAAARSASPAGNPPVADAEKEELRVALNAAQNSAAVQLLIEICLSDYGYSSSDDSISSNEVSNTLNLLSYSREVQCLVCSTLHQMFIEDPNVAKLVHFQGYPKDLVSVLVAGIPSLHICLDFVPELLQHSESKKQLFGLELASQLCLHYPLPKSLSIARLCVNVVATLVTVIPSSERCSYFCSAITTLPRFAKAFPPLLRECVSVLQQLGRVAHSYIAVHHPHVSACYTSSDDDWSFDTDSGFFSNVTASDNDPIDPHMKLYKDVRHTFYKIIEQSLS